MLELNREEVVQLVRYLNRQLEKPNCGTIIVPGILKSPGVSAETGPVAENSAASLVKWLVIIFAGFSAYFVVSRFWSYIEKIYFS